MRHVQPQSIKKTERRRSIALLTKSPLSQSPYISPSPRGSAPSSYVANSQFMRGDTESVAMESTSENSSENQHSPENDPEVDNDIDLASGIDDPELIRKVSKHLPSDFDSLKQEGADITRDLYRIKEDAQRPLLKKSRSCDSIGGNLIKSTASSFNVPGGFRREFLLNQQQHRDERLESLRTTTPNFLTKISLNF